MIRNEGWASEGRAWKEQLGSPGGRVRWLALVLGIALGGCGGGTSEPGGAVVSGQATFPPQAGGGPVAQAPVVVLDLQTGRQIPQGVTDAQGNYRALVGDPRTVAVIVQGVISGRNVRVSGLVDVRVQALKNFDGTTDVACEAGVTAVLSGALPAGLLTAERIRNLELAAARIVGTVNFLDPAAVTAAAALVRQLTNDGARPPA